MYQKLQSDNISELYKEIYDSVAKWNSIAGKSREGTPDNPTKLSVALVMEEYTELCYALRFEDAIEQVDGLCDLVFTLCGYVYENNIPFDPTKINNTIDDEFLTIDDVPDYILHGCSVLSIEDLFYTIYLYFVNNNWPFKDCMNEVIKSNYTKFVVDYNGIYRCIRNGAGKVMKPDSYNKPELGKFLKARVV